MERPENFSVCYNENLKTSKKAKNIICNPNVQKVPPDGGWGWMIAIGGIIVLTLGTFPTYGYSYLFSPILMSQGVSSFKIAWIYNLRQLIYNICFIFVGPLCDEFGYRKIALFGGLTTFVSMILCAFATSPNLLSLSYALLGGIGDSSTILLPLLIVSEYFQKRRGFVTGLFLFGSSGTFFIAPLVPSYLLQHYDYQGASLICAAIVLNQCVGAMLFQPVEWHMKLIKREQLTEKILNEENNSEYRHSEDKIDLEVFNIIPEENNFKMNNSSCVTGCMTRSKSQKSVSQIQLMANKINVKTNHTNMKYKGMFIRVLKSTYRNIKSLKNIRVQIIALAYCCFILGYINFQMWIPFIITDAGYSLESAAWCSSLVVIGDMSGKLTSSVLADRKFFNVRYGYMFGLFLIGSCIIVFTIVKEIKLYAIFICIWGFGVGLSTALLSLSMIHVMGDEMFSAVFGVSQLLRGLICSIVGILTGTFWTRLICRNIDRYVLDTINISNNTFKI
ncbi:UNVERIFIED_CONTAM: hypothetical protein RMT77_019729 [Armadillidium vulgare]